MSAKTKKTAMILIIISMVMCICSIIASTSIWGAGVLLGRVNNLVFGLIQAVVWLVAIVFAYIYFREGAKKVHTNDYRGFAYTYLVSQIIYICGYFCNAISSQGISGGLYFVVFSGFFVWLVGYTCLSILTFAKDLGLKASARLTNIAILCNIYPAIMAIINIRSGYFAIFRNLTKICLAALLFMMVKAKYEDKAKRGTN